MEGGGIDLVVTVSLSGETTPAETRFATGTGVTLGFAGVNYPGGVIQCDAELRAGETGRCVLGLIYFTKAPQLRIGDELELLAGPTKIGTASILEFA